jgi:pyruvate/2-oxoglutarate dehydrogenase complex dihydrolipoamide dehydrogenase (E3) component
MLGSPINKVARDYINNQILISVPSSVITVSHILFCDTFTPNLDLDLDKANVDCGVRIQVDNMLKTSNPMIFAIGTVTFKSP